MEARQLEGVLEGVLHVASDSPDLRLGSVISCTVSPRKDGKPGVVFKRCEPEGPSSTLQFPKWFRLTTKDRGILCENAEKAGAKVEFRDRNLIITSQRQEALQYAQEMLCDMLKPPNVGETQPCTVTLVKCSNGKVFQAVNSQFWPGQGILTSRLPDLREGEKREMRLTVTEVSDNGVCYKLAEEGVAAEPQPNLCGGFAEEGVAAEPQPNHGRGGFGRGRGRGGFVRGGGFGRGGGVAK